VTRGVPENPLPTGLALRGAPRAPSSSAPAVRKAALTANPAIRSIGTPRRVVDQADVHCCVSCALSGALEVLHPEWPALAPLFHYYVTRFDDRGADGLGFLFLDAGLSAVRGHGVCAESLHIRPFTESDAGLPPSAAARYDAENRKPASRFWFRTLSGPSWSTTIRDELRQGHAVVISFRLPVGYPGGTFLDARHEWTELEKPGLSPISHCVLVTGFNDARTALRIHDSQGATRFDKGGWWMGYRVADNGAIGDAYSILKDS
jgi:hypothetical protein